MKKLTLHLIYFLFCFAQLHANNKELMQELKKNDVHFVNFLFSDLIGHIKEVCIPLDHVESALIDGIYFDGSSVPGCSKISQSDMLLKPDMSTTRIVPWLQGNNKTALILCDIWQDAHTPFSGDPRSMLKAAVHEIEQHGYTLNVGPELEFFILKEDNSPVDTQAYFNAQTNIKRTIEHNTIMHTLRSMGVDVEKLHHEVAKGQYEFSIKYGEPLLIADQIILAKYTLSAVLQEFGHKITFMPKPFSTQNGSAMHIHFSLWDTASQQNAFYDKNDEHHLSKIGKQFFAGILHNIKSLSVIFNPSINSYKRLVPGYEAPVYICWGTKNRSALIRMPEAHSAHSVRGELRCPDPLCNPYLAFTALLKAGFEGIEQTYESPLPVEKNLYKMNAAERINLAVASLPTSLEHALELFKNSTFIFKAFGEQLANNIISLKEKEVHAYNTHVSDWELATYR